MTTIFDPDPDLVSDHRHWLSAFDPQHGWNWENLFNDNPEAAACEAAVRRLLEQNGNAVEPNGTGSSPSPDFRCKQTGRTFFVEVTCLSIQAVWKHTGPAVPHYADLTGLFFGACKDKTPQCANLHRPALVAVGTFDIHASNAFFLRNEIEQLLTGERILGLTVNTQTGESLGTRWITHLQKSTFIKEEKTTGDMGHARNPVSGMLLCGLGGTPNQVRGILHPSPLHPFDRGLLPNIEFCRLKDGYESGTLSTEWV